MPKYIPRAPGQPLEERPYDEPFITEMLSRTLFREGTLVRRQQQQQQQASVPRILQPGLQTQRPRVSIFTEGNLTNSHYPSHENSQTHLLSRTPTYTVSPESASDSRVPGVEVSPVSPLTPEEQERVQGTGNLNSNSNLNLNFTIEIEPATPCSELEPFRHWYFDEPLSNHYPEKHVSMSTNSLLSIVRNASVPGVSEKHGKRGMGINVRRACRRVRMWLRERGEVRRKVREEKRREMEGDLLVRGRDIESDESQSSSSGSDDLLGKGVAG